MEVPKITISGGVLRKNIICQVFIAKYTQKHWKNGNFWSGKHHEFSSEWCMNPGTQSSTLWILFWAVYSGWNRGSDLNLRLSGYTCVCVNVNISFNTVLMANAENGFRPFLCINVCINMNSIDTKLDANVDTDVHARYMWTGLKFSFVCKLLSELQPFSFSLLILSFNVKYKCS